MFFGTGFHLPSQNPPSLIIVIIVQKAPAAWRFRHAWRERRRASSGGVRGVVGLRHVIPLEDLLHLQVVFRGFGEGVLKDGESLLLDLVVDCGEIGYHGETLGSC